MVVNLNILFTPGKYNEAKYSENSNVYNGQQNYQQNYNNGNDDDTVVTNAANTAFARNYPTDADTPRGPTSAIRGLTGPSSGIEKAYLPPFVTSQAAETPTSSIRGPPGPSFATRGSTGRSSAVEKPYLPPLASSNGFGRRQQSFDSKNGYRY